MKRTHKKSAAYVAQLQRQAHADDRRKREAEIARAVYLQWRNNKETNLGYGVWLDRVIAGEAV